MEALKFTDKISDSSIYELNKFFGVKDIDFDITSPECTVDFILEPEYKSWGINGISITIESVTASIEWEVLTEFLSIEECDILIKAGGTAYRNDTIGGTIELDTTKPFNGKEWEVECEVEFKPSGSFQIEQVEVDLEKMKVTIS